MTTFWASIWDGINKRIRRSRSGDLIKVPGLVADSSSIQDLTATSTINPSAFGIPINSGADIELISTPAIAIATEWQQIVIFNSGNNTITFRDISIQPTSGLSISGGKLKLKPGTTAAFWFLAGRWCYAGQTPWNRQEKISNSQTLENNVSYLVENVALVEILLPENEITNSGDKISITHKGAAPFRITQRENQSIIVGNKFTTTGTSGKIESIDTGVSILIEYDGSGIWVTKDLSGYIEVI